MSNLAIKTNYFNYLYNAKEELRVKKQTEAEKARQEEEAKKKAEEEAKKKAEAENKNNPQQGQGNGNA